ncbi:MAG: hypothetical protein KJN76_08405, partial [Eudoraea sp.]|nr:hypothetical protein [Eudoraea sp.]
VERYPLDSLKIQQLDSISTMYRESAAASRSLLENTHLNILKLSDEEVLQQYNLLKRYSEKFLIPLGKMTTYHQAGIWEYMDHKKLMAQIWPGGFPLESLPEDIAGKENLSDVRIASALQLAEIVVSEIRELQRALSAKLISEKQQQEFIAVENQLISQINQLNQLLDSVGADFPRKNLDALENIISLAEANLSTYSATTELDIKLDLGRNLVVCFGHLAALEKAILALPGKQQEIETAYEDQIWNPFMANLMTERVKKRITGAYNKILLPYFLKRATLDLNCENAGEQVDLIARTHQRMLELRDEDTRKLERKLRREQDPETIINLFGRSSNTPEN